ncbi:S-adenosylmethionine transporter [Xanthoria calcicola]
MASPSSGPTPFTPALLAGALAGTTVDLSLYPIDTLKTRLQSSTGFYPSGGFRGVYAGVGSAIVGSAPGAAFFFVTYEEVKSRLRLLREDEMGKGSTSERGRGNGWIEPVEHMIAASVGEVAACAVRVPTEVVKQRAQAAQYPSSMAALRFIFAQRGDIGTLGVWREMYRGWSITILREVPFTAIQFPLWEGMKAWRRRLHGRSQTSATESGIFGSIAGAVAAGLTTPLDVLKTRMMLAKKRQATMSLFVQIWKQSGPKAFIAGLGPRVLWISAGGAVFLGTYQWALNAINGIT